MNTEQQKIEYKSLQKIRTGEKGFKELSTTCVALANAQGGQIMIGVEDKTAENGGYPPTQNGDIRSLFWLFSLMALQN